MYYTGRGVPRDYVKAAKWTRRAAEQGYALAETDLGYLYEQGKSVPLDYACTWYSVGASRGDDRGIARLKSLSNLMRPRDIADAKRLALSYVLQRGKGSEGFNADSKASMLDQQ
jgi:TPR repeat protein